MNKGEQVSNIMKKLIQIIKNIFVKLDNRILEHGERVAYLVYMILKEENKYSLKEIKDAVVFALLHDIGALKTDDIDNLITFDSTNTYPHCVYGYLFLKYFSPLGKQSKIILYHHTPCDKLSLYLSGYDFDISGLIHLTDRIDVWNLHKKKQLFENNNVYIDKYYQLFIKLNQEKHLIENINNDKYHETIEEIDLLFTVREIKKYLQMIVFIIDFRSYQTVTHSLLVALIANELGKRLKLSKKDIKYLTYSAFLHDVGKVATPLEILEKNGKLTDSEMIIMRNHIIVSFEILKNNINDKILYPAIRHHERIDGSGYPNNLTKKELTIYDNIIIISDLVSALSMKRSYKESFSQEKTVKILEDLANNNKIDKDIFEILKNNYEEIIATAIKKIANQENKFVRIKKEYQKMLKRDA